MLLLAGPFGWRPGYVAAQETVCAVTKLELGQEATLEREAFDAHLNLNNPTPQALQNLVINVNVTGPDGSPADHLFFIKVKSLAGTANVSGTGVVQSSSTADIHWLIIPSPGAGGTSPIGVVYGIKADISFVSGGVPQRIETFPAFITVKPQPLLKLEYVLPFEVFGDEPLTPAVEGVEPFPLGLRVTNVGLGTARNFKVDSAQPQIVDNKQGLLVDFKLLGATVGGQTVPNSLLVSFGDVPSNGVRQASWIMSASLSGRFTGFTSSFTHAAELGGALTSLIESVTTHTLVKDVLVDVPGRDTTPDFLVNTTEPREKMQDLLDGGGPVLGDLILESDQPAPISVRNVPARIEGTLSGAQATLTFSLTEPVAPGVWVHASVPFPQGGVATLASVRRADGKVINPKNAWISKHFRKSDLAVLYRLNILDLTSQAGSYTLQFSAPALDQPPGRVTDLAAFTGAESGTLNLAWKAPGEDGFAGDIFGGRYRIQFEEDPAVLFSPDRAQVSFATTTSASRTESFLLSGLVGNSTFFVHLWTQDSGGTLSETSNQATAYALPHPPRNLVFELVTSTSISLRWETGNNREPIQYQVFLDTDTQAPFIAESPFFGTVVAQRHTFGGLTAGTTFFVLGRARNPDTLASSPVAVLGSTVTLPPDVLPPRTTLSVEGPKFGTDPVFVTSASVFNLTAVDDRQVVGDGKGVGVAETRFAVDSDTFTVFTGTFSILQEGARVVRFFSIDGVGNAESTGTAAVSVDLTPPITEVVFGSPTFRSPEGLVFVSSNSLISFKAEDPLGGGVAAGVAGTLFRVDGGTLAPFAQPFTLTEGIHLIEFRSEDRLGHLEALKAVTVRVDATPPVTELAVSTPVFVSSAATFVATLTPISFLARDPEVKEVASGVSGTRFAVDLGPLQNFTTAFTLQEGTHTLTLFSLDNVENREAEKTASLTADGTPPTVVISSPVAGARFVATRDKIRIEFTVADNFDPAPGFAAFLTQTEDRGSPRGTRPTLVPVTTGQVLEPLDIDDGIWELKVEARDFVENSTAAFSGRFEVIHDIQPPRTALDVGEPKSGMAPVFLTGLTPIRLVSEDDLIEVADRLGLGVALQEARLRGTSVVFESSFTLRNPDPRQGQVFVSTITASEAPDGLYLLDFQAEDIIGNREKVKTSSVAVDNTTPQTRITFGLPSFVEGGRTFISTRTEAGFVAQDPVVNGAASGVALTEFRINGGFFQTFISTFTFEEGIRQVAFRSRDRLGNLEVAKSSTVHVDGTPPVSTVVVTGISFLAPPGDAQAVGGPLFVASHTLIGIRAEDPLVKEVASGVLATFFGLDMPPLQPFTTAFAIPAEGAHTVTHRSLDRVENLEQDREFRVSVDTTPPVTELSFQGAFSTPQPGSAPPEAEVFVATETLVVLTARDPVSKGVASGAGETRFRIDGGSFTAYAGPFRIPGEGLHTLEWQSFDRVSNDERLNIRRIAVDQTPPESALSIETPQARSPDGLVLVSSRTPFVVISADPVSGGVASGVKDSFLAVDTAPFTAVTGPVTLSGPDGPRAIAFFSRDNVLNAEAVKSTTVVLDATPPIALLLSPSSEAKGMDQVFGKGLIPVVATLSDLHFKSFTLEFAPLAAAATGFTLIAQGTSPAAGSVIVRWDTSNLSGFFTLRLTATDLVENAAVATATVFIGDPALRLALENTDKGKRLLEKPEGVAVDSLGNIHVANTGRNEVLKFSPEGRLMATFDGLTTLVPTKPENGKDKNDDDKDKPKTIRFDKPTGLAVDSEFNLYVADRNNNRIAILNLMGSVSRSVGRTNPEGKFTAGKGPGEFNKPTGVAVSRDRIAVADRNNERVQVFDLNFNFLFQIKLAEAAPVAKDPEDDDDDEDEEKQEDDESKPFGVALDKENNIYVTDEENGRILAFDPNGKLLFASGKEGKLLGQFENPKGVAASPLKYLYAADRGNKRVQKIDPFQRAVLAFGAAFRLHHPVGMALDESVNLYVTDRKESRVLKFGLPDGTLVVTLPPRQKIKKMRIGPSGGRVEREDGVNVDIPEGAIKAEVEVTIGPEKDAAPEEKKRKEEMRGLLGLKAVSEGVEYGPEGTKFEKPVTITLAYDTKALPAGTKEEDLLIYHWNPDRPFWEALKSTVDKANRTVSAQTTHFSLYQVFAVEEKGVGTIGISALIQAADPAFKLGEVYVFPNPARGGTRPTFHIEVGIADSVRIKIHDIAGELVHETTLTGTPQVIDDGQGPQYAYEYAWEGRIPSGVYLYVVTAQKGSEKLQKTGKFGVVR